MKKDNLLVLGALGAYAAWKLGALSKFAKSISYAPAAIRAEKQGDTILITIGLDITNPTASNVKVRRTYGFVYDPTGAQVAKFETQPYEVKANAVTRLNLPFSISLKGAALGVINSFINKNGKFKVEYVSQVGIISDRSTMEFSLRDLIEYPGVKNLKKVDKQPNPLITT